MSATATSNDIGSGVDTGRRGGWQESQIDLTRKQKMNLTFATLRPVRTTWEARWADSAMHSDPYGFQLTPIMANQGFRKDQNLLDTTPLECRKVLKAGMFTSVTPSASMWFKMQHPDPDKNKIPAIQTYNDYCTKVYNRAFTISNFYQEAPNYYDKCGTYGTSAMFFEEDFEKLFNCTVFSTGSYWCSVDKNGIVDTFIYQVRMTVREVIDEFCTDPFTNKINLDNCSKALVNYYNNHYYEAPIDIIHFIGPRDLYAGHDGDKNKNPHPYKTDSPLSVERKYGSWRYEWSLNAEMTTGQEEAFGDAFLSESGYDLFPVLVTPWSKTNKLDSYGSSSPGLDALPDEHELFFTRSQALIIKEKVQSPPVAGSPMDKQDDFSDLPGAFNPESPNQDSGKGLRAVYQIGHDAIAAYAEDVKQLQEKVKECWETNTFQILSNYENLKDVTAMAVTELKGEKMQKLGAVYGTFDVHFIKKLFPLIHYFCEKRKLLPPPPEEYGTHKPVPELLGVMAQAMKLSNLSIIERFVQMGQTLQTAFPTFPVVNELNVSRIYHDYGDTLSIDSSYFNTPEEKAAIQAAQAKAQQQKQQNEALPAAAAATKNLAQAPMDNNNALTQMLQANQAGGGQKY